MIEKAGYSLLIGTARFLYILYGNHDIVL